MAAIDAALKSLAAIRPDMCVQYVRDWNADRKAWEKELTGNLRPGQILSIDEALTYLGLAASRTPASMPTDRLAQPPAHAGGPANFPRPRHWPAR